MIRGATALLEEGSIKLSAGALAYVHRDLLPRLSMIEPACLRTWLDQWRDARLALAEGRAAEVAVPLSDGRAVIYRRHQLAGLDQQILGLEMALNPEAHTRALRRAALNNCVLA